MEERCQLCSNHCLKSELQCGRGRQFFNQNRKLSKHEFMHKNDLTSKLMKCGHILMHKTGKNRGQEKILDILSKKTSISQKELQDILGIEAGSLSEILSKLENNGLIFKQRDEKDKRKLIIQLTDKGTHITKYKKNNDEDMFDMLNETEIQQLNDILDRILSTWDKHHMKYYKNNEK